MKQTNPKLIYHLRQHAKPLTMTSLHHLYADGGRLDEDLAVLERFGLVRVAGNNVAWRGS